MMGSSRTNEKGKAPAYCANIIPPNVDEDSLDSILYMPLSSSGWEDIHQPVAQGVPETIRNPRVCSMDLNSFQNPQINHSFNSANMNLQEVPLLPECSMGWGQQYMNQGSNAISSGGINSFGSFNRPQVNRNVSGSSFLFSPSDTAPVHTQNNVSLNTDKSGLQGIFEGSFLSLGVGGTSDNLSSYQMTSTNNELGSHGSLNRGLSSSPNYILQMQQNDRPLGRADKLIEPPSTELKMVHARKATSQTFDADFMGFQRNNSGFSDQFSNVDRMTSTNYDVGVHSTLNSGLASRQSIRSVDIDHYKGKQYVHSATLGGKSAHFFNSQQHNLKPSESVKSSWMTSNHTPSERLQYFRSTGANNPKYAGQIISQNATPNQVLGGNLYSQRTKTPQVSWVGSGPAGIDIPFPKRLGVESNKGSTHVPHNFLRPIGRSDGAPVSYPMSFQEPFYGQSKNALLQRPKGPQGAPSTNVSSVDSQSQKFDFHVRPYHKRTAAAPQSASHWIQRQKITHPTVHHSMLKPPVPVTTALVHPSIPDGSLTEHMGPIPAHIPPVIPCVSHVKHRVPVASAPAVSHITWKDPDATSKLSGHKCFLCKRDLALTSEGAVFQPAVPPPVAVLPCGHTFHDQCLRNITPDDQAKDPPCIPCAIGEN